MIPVKAIHDVINDQTVTGQEFDAHVQDRVGAIAGHLSPEKRCVLITHGASVAFFVDLFATWAAGGCAACLNAGLTAPELERLIQTVEPALILRGESALDLDPDVPVLSASAHLHGSASPLDWSLDDPGLILFTSGSSGSPKGVVLTRRAILSRLALNVAHIGPDALAHSLNMLPTHFGHGLIGNCLTPLYAGGTLYLNRSTGISTAAEIGTVIDRYRITFMSSVPGFWKIALRVSKPPRLGSLMRVSVGSAPLAPDLWREIKTWSGTEVWNMYGLTEAAKWVAGTNEPGAGVLGHLWGGRAAVRNDKGQVTETGEGELLLQGPSLMTGYFRRPDLTRDVLSHGWYCTGDMGRIDEAGLHLLGRKRYVVNIDGLKIYPKEIDELFERHPDITEACAFAQGGAVSGERHCLVVAGAAGLDPHAVIDWRATTCHKRRFFIVYMWFHHSKNGSGKGQSRCCASTCARGPSNMSWTAGDLIFLETERITLRSIAREDVGDTFLQ